MPNVCIYVCMCVYLYVCVILDNSDQIKLGVLREFNPQTPFPKNKREGMTRILKAREKEGGNRKGGRRIVGEGEGEKPSCVIFLNV
jgi:hypothetical protein